MVGAIERGLALADFDLLTVGMLIDYVMAHNEIVGRTREAEVSGKTKARPAQQNDFDRF